MLTSPMFPLSSESLDARRLVRRCAHGCELRATGRRSEAVVGWWAESTGGGAHRGNLWPVPTTRRDIRTTAGTPNRTRTMTTIETRTETTNMIKTISWPWADHCKGQQEQDQDHDISIETETGTRTWRPEIQKRQSRFWKLRKLGQVWCHNLD